jgi:hypothetical protein
VGGAWGEHGSTFVTHWLNARVLLRELIFLTQKKSIQEQIIMQINHPTGYQQSELKIQL